MGSTSGTGPPRPLDGQCPRPYLEYDFIQVGQPIAKARAAQRRQPSRPFRSVFREPTRRSEMIDRETLHRAYAKVTLARQLDDKVHHTSRSGGVFIAWFPW